MTYRGNFLQRLISGQVELPAQLPVDKLERDYKWFYRNLVRLGKEKEIGLTKETERKTIWFRRRRQ